MERTTSEQVQPASWSVGEKLKAFIERLQVAGIARNIKRLRDSKMLPDAKTMPYEPLASVTMTRYSPDGLVVESKSDEDSGLGLRITITGFWEDNGRVVIIVATAEQFSDGEVVNNRSWSYDVLNGVTKDGMGTFEVASVLAHTTSVLLEPVKVPSLDSEEP